MAQPPRMNGLGLRVEFDRTVEVNTRMYIGDHVALVNRVGKPLVIEEFGFPRDASYASGSSTLFKDRFYKLIYDAVLEGARGGPIAGSNFWACGGRGRSARTDNAFRPGDTSYVGNPPHEPQGRYGVFDADESTMALIRAQVAQLRAANG